MPLINVRQAILNRMHHLRRRVATFTDRYPHVGPILWQLSLQYFVIQLVVARAWHTPFSLSQNTISDLGNTACTQYGGRYVCSPWFPLMNASFIVLGLTMALGAGLIYQEFRPHKAAASGFTGLFLAGIGTLIVGLFPENSIGIIHATGAAMPFLLGNIAIIILGHSLPLPKWLGVYSIASGIIALIGLVLFVTGVDFGLGMGTIERVTAYPQTLWLIVFGLYISKTHYAPALSKRSS